MRHGRATIPGRVRLAGAVLAVSCLGAACSGVSGEVLVGSAADEVDTHDDARSVVEELLDAIMRGDVATFGRLLDPDVMLHGFAESQRTLFREHRAEFLSGLRSDAIGNDAVWRVLRSTSDDQTASVEVGWFDDRPVLRLTLDRGYGEWLVNGIHVVGAPPPAASPDVNVTYDGRSLLVEPGVVLDQLVYLTIYNNAGGDAVCEVFAVEEGRTFEEMMLELYDPAYRWEHALWSLPPVPPGGEQAVEFGQGEFAPPEGDRSQAIITCGIQGMDADLDRVQGALVRIAQP